MNYSLLLTLIIINTRNSTKKGDGMNPPPGNEKLKNYKLAGESFAMSLDILLASYKENVKALTGVNSSSRDVFSSMPSARLRASSIRLEMRLAISPFLLSFSLPITYSD